MRSVTRKEQAWIINPETQGTFLYGDCADWRYNFGVGPGQSPDDITPEYCAAVIRKAIGADIPLEIISILRWRHDQAVADRWRYGRIFLAGDAAHRFPPHGGFGMNSGVQDSSNLAWKLVAVLPWGASEHLLDSYEAERRPVAEFNGEQCMHNTRELKKTGWMFDPEVLAPIETSEGAALRQRIADNILLQRDQFYSHGQQFGLLYDSSAILGDGTEPIVSSVSEYRANARPGARAPHQWVRSGGRKISTLGLYQGGFVLIAGPDAAPWKQAAERIAAAGGPPLRAFGFAAISN